MLLVATCTVATCGDCLQRSIGRARWTSWCAGWVVTHVVQSCEKKTKKRDFGAVLCDIFSCWSAPPFGGCTGVAYRCGVCVSGNLPNLFVVWDGRGRGRCWRTAGSQGHFIESLQVFKKVFKFPPALATHQRHGIGATCCAWVHDPFGVRPVRR
jgi:hypothetical protein